MAAIRQLVLAILLLLYIARTALAETSVEFVGSAMQQYGHGGRQVFDGSGNQRMTVYEPTLYLESKVTKDTTVFASGLIDLWSAASDRIFDTATGASGGKAGQGGGGYEDRKAFDIGVARRLSSWTLTPTFGYSNELTYHSIHGGLRVDRSLANDNFVLSASYKGFFDETHPFDLPTSRFANWKAKTAHSFDLSGSQILTPDDLLQAGYSFIVQTGYLSSIRNIVRVGGFPVLESLPGHRDRHAVYLRYVHALSDVLSAHLDYRYYIDTWGLDAHSIEPSLYASFHDEQGLARLYYRLYTQSPVRYYANGFAFPATFMTSDSDLQRFTANEAGVMLSHSWDVGSFLKSVNASATALYYWRSNDLSAFVYQVGFGGMF